MNEPLRPWQHVLLGSVPRQRMALTMSLVAASVYMACIAMQWLWVEVGAVPVWQAVALTGVMAVGQLSFLAVLRSPWPLGLKDPSLTLPQMVFAIFCLCAAHVINPPLRAVILAITALVLSYSALALTPRRCVQLSWFALTTLGVVTAADAITRPDDFKPWNQGMSFLVVSATLLAIGRVSARLSRLRIDHKAQRAELRAALERVHALATHDELTGLPNRRHIREWIDSEVPRVRRSLAPLCIAIIDLDHFKQINDRLGHPVGDRVLVNFAGEAQAALRAGDALARWGGEEFLLGLPDTAAPAARAALDRLQVLLRQPACWLRCPEGRVTFSAGLAQLRGDESFEQLLARADAAVYEAKRLGRDRCVQA